MRVVVAAAAAFPVVLVQRQGSKVPTAPVRLFIRQHKADGAAGGIEGLLGCTQVSAASSTSGTVRAVHAFGTSVSAQWHFVFVFGSCRAGPSLASSEIASFSNRDSAAEPMCEELTRLIYIAVYIDCCWRRLPARLLTLRCWVIC